MAVRIRADGTIVCAAMHPAEPGDVYVDDAVHYRLSVDLGLIVSEPWEADPDNPGLGGHGSHGLWWPCNAVPGTAVLESRPNQ